MGGRGDHHRHVGSLVLLRQEDRPRYQTAYAFLTITQSMKYCKTWSKYFNNWEILSRSIGKPGSDRTSLAAAISMNTFCAFSRSGPSGCLSGCQTLASFRYALLISFVFAFLKINEKLSSAADSENLSVCCIGSYRNLHTF